MKQRDIVLVPFPFSDTSGSKIRPALVLSNEKFNKASNDVVICAITSNLKQTPYSLVIDQKDIEIGKLYDISTIKAESIAKINKSFVLKTIAMLKKQTFTKVVMLLNELVKPD
jgi:mRNA interferase MazF